MQEHAANWEHCLEHAALSDIGLRRANNQDALAVVIAGSQEMFQQRGHLFMVADGMGAHAAGELASKLATDVVALTYSKRLDLPPAEAILTATREANQQIHGRGQADPDFKGSCCCRKVPWRPTWATAGPTACVGTGLSS